MKRLIEIKLSNCGIVSSPQRIDIPKMKSARAFEQLNLRVEFSANSIDL
jgi:hypothetical protein